MDATMTHQQVLRLIDDARRLRRPALLAGANLEGASLRGFDLRGASLQGARAWRMPI